MTALPIIFLASATLGGGVLVLQLLLGMLGAGHDDAGHGFDHDTDHGSALDDGLELVTVRGIAAGLTFFGIAGLATLSGGGGAILATALALAAGVAADVGVASLMHRLRRLESDGVLRIEGAVGLPAQVHVRLPATPGEAGKVLLTLQNRLVELAAVSLEGEIPSGTPVTVVGIAGPKTVEVVRTPDPGA